MKRLLAAALLLFAFATPSSAGVDPVARGLALTASRAAYQNNASVSHTGDTTETTLATINLPAGAMGANGFIKLFGYVTFTGTTAGKTIKVKIGGTTVISFVVASSATSIDLSAEIWNANATNSQIGRGRYINSSSTWSEPTQGTASIDTTAATTITITGTLGNAADSIALVGTQALLYPHN